jgi:hypothetical protein
VGFYGGDVGSVIKWTGAMVKDGMFESVLVVGR